MPSSRARRAAAAPLIPQSTETTSCDPVSFETVEGGRLEAVAVAQAFGNEVDDVPAEQLQRAPQDDRGGDAVDVVVAVDRDALAGGNGLLEPHDGALHVGQPERVQQVLQ